MASDKEAEGGSSSMHQRLPQSVSMKVELKPFTGKENFTLWQRRMKSALTQQNLSVVLEGKEKKPVTMTDAEWGVLDELARGAIENFISDEVLINVMKDTAKQTWEKLEEMFAGKSLSNKLFLKEELLNLRMAEEGNLMEHLSSFNRCVADLQRMDVLYNTEDKALMLLTSLPPSYKHFRTTLMFGKSTLNFEEVVQDVMTHHRMSQRSEENSQDAGLFARSRSSKQEGKGSKRNTKSKDNEGCFECGSMDHWRRDCPVWKEKLNKMKKAGSSAHVCDEDTCDELLTVTDESNGEVMASSSCKNSSSSWILDSGCSYHVCANKLMFDTYEDKDACKIMLGDKTTCEVLGIGTVKIKLQGGEVWTLSEVRFVPALRTNLVSLGSLDREGCSYKAKGGKLMVTQGSVVVMRGEIQPNNTYKLLGGAEICTKEEQATSHNVKETVQHNVAASVLKRSWARKVSQGCMTNGSSSKVLDFKAAESVERNIHKGEIKTRNDGEDVVEEKLLAKVVMEGTPFEVELDTRAEEGRQQQQTHKGVLLEVEPSSNARSGPKESIKPSLGFGWMDQEVPTTFRSAIGSMKRESWRSALMKRNVFLNPRARSTKWGFSEQRFGMGFAYQGKSKVQGSKEARSNEFGKGELFSAQEVHVTQV